MRRILCPYATASVVLAGAGLIGVAPAGAPLPDVQVRNVALASDADSLGPWQEVFNTASQNATTLLNNYFIAPGVALQQMLANQAGMVQQLLDDPLNINSVAIELQNNLDAVTTGYGLQGASAATTDTVLAHTLDDLGPIPGKPGGHMLMFDTIPSYLPADQAATITPIINFLASPASGIIMGTLGPAISPWVALLNSITDGDDVNTTLANMVGGFLNGATLNLDSLVPTINGLLGSQFPAGMAMTHLDIGFGGLLSTGSIAAGPYDVDGNEIPAVGGSIFNSIGLDFSGVPIIDLLELPSKPIGPLGAWEGWAQTIASLIGWGGDGAPLAGADLPVVPDDGGASAAAVDLSTWWHDLIAAL